MDYFKATESQVLICDCHSDEHQILIHYDEDDREVYLHVHLASQGFWSRLIYAIKYLFGYKSKYGAWDSFIFRRQDAHKLSGAAVFLTSPRVDPMDFHRHPYTCDCSGGDKCERFNGTGDGQMGSRDGWFQCPCGEYKQRKL
jgi:hypothetical protein